MDKELNISEIKILAAYKTNNENITEQEAIKILNSVLPDYAGINSCKAWSVQSGNQSAFGTTSSITVIKDYTETSPARQEPETKQLQNTVLSDIRADLDKALLLYNNQTDIQGIISRLYNSGKNILNTDYSANNVEKALITEVTGLRLLELAANNELTAEILNKESPSTPLKNRAPKELIDFKEAYRVLRGVKYDPEAIKTYAEKEAQMAVILAVKNKNTEIKELLHDATIAVDYNNKYGAPFQRATEPCIKNLERCITTTLTKLYGNNEELINEFLNNSGTSYIDGKLKYNTFAVRDYVLVNISKRLQNMADDNLTKLLNNRALEEYETEYNKAYKRAYGEQNGLRLAQAFAVSQMNGVEHIKTGVQAVGMLIMIAGQIIPVGGQTAAALVYGGMTTAAAGGSAVHLGEAITRRSGISDEDKQIIARELATSAALMFTGAGVGKVSSAAYAELIMQNCPRLMALSAKIGTDATLSVVADYAITGQINLTSEGISQLIPIVTGVLKTRGAMQTNVNARVKELQKGEILEYLNNNPEKLDGLTKILLQNKAPIGHIANLDEKHWFSVIQSVETPPTGLTKVAMLEYKKGSWEINGLLSSLKSGADLPTTIKQKYNKLTNYINDITDYINTQTLKEPITVYRDDSYGILSSVKLDNGNTLDKELEMLANSGDINFIKHSAKILSKQDFEPIEQKRFLSTTFVKELHYNNDRKIRWELNVPAGTKGTFIEAYNTLKSHGNEVEFLIQRDSKIIIRDIQWLDNKWYIKADIEQE